MKTHEQNLISELLDAAKAAGADGADATLARGEGNSVDIRLGKVEAAERSEDYDVGMRVFVGQRTASISTSQLDSDTIKQLAERAVAMAKLAPEDPYVRLAKAEELASDIPELDMFDATETSVETLTERAKQAEDAALSHKGITNSDGASASFGVVNVLIATSNGFSASYKRSSSGVSAVVIAEKDGQMERDYDYSAAVFAEDLDAPDAIGHSAAKRTLSRLGASKPKTGQFPVIYDQRVSSSIVSTLAGAINGAAIARGTSFLKDSLGEQIASKGLNFIDDPLRSRGMGSRLFDGEGLSVSRRLMVKDGVLTGWFLDLASAAKLEMIPTGNARRSMGGAPSPSASNFFLENGTLSRADMIADIKEGFLVTEMMGSSVDMITGDYSRGAGGFWIVDGNITGPVTEATIAGNLKDMLMAITTADDIDMRDSIAAPSLRIDGMMVAGS
ncbi:MAG: TldD/PmbA family protein [Candidatus Puniceispirillum sp.]|jgi:PmbA protein|uniref:TldD/PmbA family protein n=2 Tax=Candidatus Puniceispirillum TaxID=767891 RepID=UPI002A72D15E|nr:TldD/PmbA family protein [Candidatus Puniceispirillum sp.]MBT6567180.1 TldD/PmbA family protein [Candidatus Puniceispirillum sp.]